MVAPSGPTSGFPWGGPPFFCSNPLYENEYDCVHNGGTWTPTEYPSNDTGFEFDWAPGQIDVSLTSTPDWRDLRWIYGDWLGPLPRAIYDAGVRISSGF